MSDYTPTTEQVRFAYIDRRDFDSQVGLGEGPGDEEAGAEFDRWLASVKAEAWDEGHHAGRLNEIYRDHTRNFWRMPPTNPYREQETP